jgi:hypothetical protein
LKFTNDCTSHKFYTTQHTNYQFLHHTTRYNITMTSITAFKAPLLVDPDRPHDWSTARIHAAVNRRFVPPCRCDRCTAYRNEIEQKQQQAKQLAREQKADRRWVAAEENREEIEAIQEMDRDQLLAYALELRDKFKKARKKVLNHISIDIETHEYSDSSDDGSDDE